MLEKFNILLRFRAPLAYFFRAVVSDNVTYGSVLF